MNITGRISLFSSAIVALPAIFSCGGGNSGGAMVFNMDAPAATTVQPGTAGSVTAKRVGADTVAISLSLAENPQGITGSGTIEEGAPTGTVKLDVPAGVPEGSYSLKIDGIIGAVHCSAPLNLTVSNGPVAGAPNSGAVPGAPEGVNVTTLGNTAATVTCVAPATDGGSAIISYTAIARVVGGDGAIVSTATASDSTVTVGDLINGTNYNITMKATNSAGSGPESAPRTGIPDANGPVLTPDPSVPATPSTPSTPSTPDTPDTPVKLGPLAAFPGCEGMGSGATGGRGGDVYTVNTLSDTVNSGCVPQNGPNGPTCSLRDAMTKTGKRTIVFSVSGTITLTSSVWGVPANLTIAGQTAPNGGIQVRGPGPGHPDMGNNRSMLWINGGNTVVRYMRLRPGNADANAANQGLIALTIEGTNDTVLDHNSFEWDSSKAVSWNSTDRAFQRNTFSWNLDAEGLSQVGSEHSTGIIISSKTQTYLDTSSWDGHHNVFATINHRLPYVNVKYGRWINNLLFGYSWAGLIGGGTQFDIIGNVYDGGLSSNFKAVTNRKEVRWGDTVAHYAAAVPGGKAQIYMRNNFGPNNPLGTSNNFNAMLRIADRQNDQLNDNQVDTQYMAAGPTIPASLNKWPITISTLKSYSDLKGLLTPTVGAYQKLDCKGAWVPNRDALDTKIIKYIMNPATSPKNLVTTAGPYPELGGAEKRVDTDGDGMPDEWEDGHGLNKRDASDRNITRPNASGYTNLELYLSGLFPNGAPLP